MAVDLCQESIINVKRTMCSDIATTYIYSTCQTSRLVPKYRSRLWLFCPPPFPSFRQQPGVQRSSKLRGVPPLEPKRIAPEKKKASLASCQSQTSWWFQPIWKNISQNGSFPQIGVRIKKYLKPPPSKGHQGCVQSATVDPNFLCFRVEAPKMVSDRTTNIS